MIPKVLVHLELVINLIFSTNVVFPDLQMHTFLQLYYLHDLGL